MKYRTDLILGEAFCLFIFFYFLDSGLSVLNGLQFYFWLRDSENRELKAICAWLSCFEKNSSYVSSLSVCIFVAWCVQISVAGANKVEGTMSWCVRKQWDFGIWHYIHSAWGQTRAVWDRHVDCSQFFRLLLRLKVFRSMILKYLYDSNAEYSDGAV